MENIKDDSLEELFEEEDIKLDEEDIELENFDLQTNDLYKEEEDIEEEPEEPQEPTKDLDVLKASKIISPKAKPNTAVTKSAPGYISIVNAKKGGKRIEVSSKTKKELTKKEGDKLEAINIGFIEGAILITLDESCGTQYNVKKQGSKSIIYNSKLVAEVEEMLDLDFSNRTTITLTEGALKKLESGSLGLVVSQG